VKALTKPSAPAWAVNQLYWQDPKAFERLLTLSERIRKAQTGQLKHADLRPLIDEKKQMTVALLTKASVILDDAGHAASADSMRRVSVTLESLAACASLHFSFRPSENTNAAKWRRVRGLVLAGRRGAKPRPPA
jgi:hypothetical protein